MVQVLLEAWMLVPARVCFVATVGRSSAMEALQGRWASLAAAAQSVAGSHALAPPAAQSVARPQALAAPALVGALELALAIVARA